MCVAGAVRRFVHSRRGSFRYSQGAIASKTLDWTVSGVKRSSTRPYHIRETTGLSRDVQLVSRGVCSVLSVLCKPVESNHELDPPRHRLYGLVVHIPPSRFGFRRPQPWLPSALNAFPAIPLDTDHGFTAPLRFR
jgi:hypothetical protein